MRLVLFTLSIGVILISVTLSSISSASPAWIYFESPEDSPVKLRSKFGLFERCDQSILDKSVWACRKFPKQDVDCRRPRGAQILASSITSERDGAGSEDMMQATGLLWSIIRQAKVSESQGRGQEVSDTLASVSLRDQSQLRTSNRLEIYQSRRHRDYEYTSFCSLWRLAGYTSQLSIVFGAGSLLTLLVVLGGGRKARTKAWPICAFLVGLHAAFQIATMAIIIQAYRTDQRFSGDGTRLGFSFGCSLAAWILNVLLALVMVITGLFNKWEIPEKTGENKPLLNTPAIIS